MGHVTSLADGTGLEPGLETEPGELASEQDLRRGARGCERLGVKDSWRRSCPLLILPLSADIPGPWTLGHREGWELTVQVFVVGK